MFPSILYPHFSFIKDNIQKEIKRGPSVIFDCFGSDYERKGQQEVDVGFVGRFHQVLIKYAESPVSILIYHTVLLKHFSSGLLYPYYSIYNLP